MSGAVEKLPVQRHEAAQPAPKPPYMCELRANLASARELSITFSWPHETTRREMNDQLDELTKVIRRQQVASEIEGLELELREAEAGVLEVQKHLTGMRNKMESAPGKTLKPPEQAVMVRHQEDEARYLTKILHHKERLTMLQAVLADRG